MTKKSKPIHPGKILYEQAMQPLGVSRNKLARDIDVPVGRISDIVAGKRGITPDTALRLGKYFGTSAEMWMQFQSDFDLFVARNSEWKDIASRVREMQPIDPNAVAPVTALDAHSDRMDDFLDDHPNEDVSEIGNDAAQELATAADETPLPDVPSRQDIAEAPEEESSEKWWSTSLSDTPETTLDEGVSSSNPDIVMGSDGARDQTDGPEPTAESSTSERTITLDVKPKDGSADPVDAGASDPSLSDSQPAATQKTFEIDIHPTSSESQVVSNESGATDDTASVPQFQVDVVREAAQALRTTPDVSQGAESSDEASGPPDPLSEENFTIEFDEDELATELPGDAFAAHDEEHGSAHEVVNQQKQDAYAPAIARTGTDDVGRTDPPFAGPGLDLATSASASLDPNREMQGGLGDLTPSGWSSALEKARRDEPTLANSVKSGLGAASTASDIEEHVDVPLPSDFEPTLDGSLPPWTPPAPEEHEVSLDIPDPEEAPKLYEYDD